MTIVSPSANAAAELLAPVAVALRAMPVAGLPSSLTPGLIVHDPTGWLPATHLVDGSRLTELLESAQRRWRAPPHTAAAVAWKSYSYWLTLPAVLGWASARRMPLLRPADVLTRIEDRPPFLTFGLRRSVTVAVLASDRLATAGQPQAHVVGDEEAMLRVLRESLLDAHLAPLVEAIHARVKVGTRTLLGSVSSGIAYGVLRTAGVLPGVVSGSAVEAVEAIGTLLRALGLDDLIELVPGPGGEPTVRRKTCCQAFALPESKICAGCCIKPPRVAGRIGAAHPRRRVTA